MDIVERLCWSGQDAFTKHYSLGMWKLHEEAAVEINRLRSDMAQINRFLESIEGAGYGGMAEYEIARMSSRDAAKAHSLI